MKKLIEELKAELLDNVKECKRFAKKRAAKGEYADAVELINYSECYKRIAFKVDKILKRVSVAADDTPRSR